MSYVTETLSNLIHQTAFFNLTWGNYLMIAVAAYSYMSLVPVIQPPIMKLLTTEKERKIKMEQLRPVSKLEKILFPIIVTIIISTSLMSGVSYHP